MRRVAEVRLVLAHKPEDRRACEARPHRLRPWSPINAKSPGAFEPGLGRGHCGLWAARDCPPSLKANPACAESTIGSTQINGLAEKSSLHFRSGCEGQALAVSAESSCSAGRMRFGKTMP